MTIDWIPTGATRSIPAKSMGNRGLFPSNKVPSRIAEYESCLERDFFLECDHAADVARFQHQPVTIAYEDGKGKSRKYTPDVFVEFTSGIRGLYEIKYEEEVANKGDQYEERWNAAKDWAKSRGMTFSLLTELMIRTPRWFNIWFTLGSAKCTTNDRYVPDLIALISTEGVRYNDLCLQLAEVLGIEVTKSAQILCYAIYHGLVFVDTFSTQQIAAETVIRKRNRNAPSPFRPLREELGATPMPGGSDLTSPSENNDSFESPNILPNFAFKLPAKYEEKVNARLEVVKSWLRQPSKNRTPQWRADFCARLDMSEKTVYNWVSAYQKGGIEGLIPNHQKSGRLPKWDDTTRQLMENARQYFQTPLVTLHNAYAKLEELCKEHELAVPIESYFKAYVYKNTTNSEFARKRGTKYYKAHFSPSLASFQGACAPMQVLQMDNTSFDVFPVDSEAREGLPTPYMTAAIDCYTRMLTGFSVSYYPSSTQSVLEVLVQSVLPKQKYVNAYATQQEWPIQGFPVLLLVDNGMDFRSQSLMDFCAKYDLIIEYAPIRTPRFKAFIEEWFNVLHHALKAENVDGTRPSLKARLENPDLKPEANAVLTLQEIEGWLHKWVLDEYHFTNPYEDRAPAPVLRWQDCRAGHTGIILPSPREPPADKREVDLLCLSTLERIDRVLQSYGVMWSHLKYNSRELARVFNNIGKQNVEVLLNRRDVRSVWVVPPNMADPIRVGLASGWAQAIAKVHGDLPINASAWATELALLKDHLGRQISPYDYQREMSRIQRQELLQAAKQTTRSVRKAREKANESSRKEILGGTRGEVGSGPQPAGPKVTAPGDLDASDLPVPPKKIDWSRIKPAGRRPRRSF